MLPGVLQYPAKYDFVGLMKEVFRVPDLQQMGMDELGQYSIFCRDDDQHTKYHRTFYEAFGRVFQATYEAFVSDWVVHQIDGMDHLYQTVPTFRVHLPDNLAVGEFHRDADYHHQQGEINFWLPVTEAFDTNSLWIESEPGRADFSPVRLTPGEVYMFDGVNLSHGNKVNRTGVTRVSFDFRLISRHRFTNTDRVSVSAGRRMSIGHYWSTLARDSRL